MALRPALLAAALLLVLTPAGSAAGEPATRFEIGRAGPGPLVTVRARYAIENPGIGVVAEAVLWAYAPSKAAAGHRLVMLETSHPATLHEGDEGNLVLRIAPGRLPPFGRTVVTVTAAVESAEESRLPRPGLTHLAAAPLAEADAEPVRLVARSLVGASSAATVAAMDGWIRSNVVPDAYDPRERGALAALTDKRGDCTDMAWLLVALARAVGVPARLMGGYTVAGSALLDPDAYHNWAEYHDGAAWRVVDPHAGALRQPAGLYIATNGGGAGAGGPLSGYHRFRVEPDALRVRMLGQ